MNIVSVSWADHLAFGEDEGRLDTPETLARRIRAWRDELGAGAPEGRLARGTRRTPDGNRARRGV